MSGRKQISDTFVVNIAEAGERGQIGRFPYFCEDFDPSPQSPRYTERFVINSVQAPYFRYINPNTGAESYHVFNPETEVVESPTMAEMWTECGGNINNYPWQPMTNDFNYLITKALFANFARLATFVMNGNLMFSLQGKGFYYNQTYARWEIGDDLTGSNIVSLPAYYLDNNSLKYLYSQSFPSYSFIDEDNPETYYTPIFEGMTGTYDENEVNVETNILLKAGTAYKFTKNSERNCYIVLKYGGVEVYAFFETLFTVKEDITVNLVAERESSSDTMSYSNVCLYAYNFSPNIAINGLTGKVVMNNAISRGTFQGNGEFGNVRTDNIRIGGGAGTIVSFFENQEMVFSKANGTEISGRFSIDANGFFKFNAI